MKKKVFVPEKLEEWSVFDLTLEMITIASELWYNWGMQGDYERIADKMGISSAPFSVTEWKRSMMKKDE